MNSNDERLLVAEALTDAFATICDGQAMGMVGAVLASLTVGWIKQAEPRDQESMMAFHVAMMARIEKEAEEAKERERAH